MAINTEKSQLGLGSGNVLSWDILDKLKSVDTKNLVSTIDTKIQTNLTQQKDLTAIKTLLSNFKSNVSSLTDDTSYLKRSVSSSGSGSATVDASTGVNEQTMKIKVSQLASQDVYQSKKFELKNESVLSPGSAETSFKLSIGLDSYEIEINASTTLEDIANKINEATDGKIQAKVLNVGGENPYSLVIQSKDSGKDNEISFSYVQDSAGSIDNSKNLMKSLGFMFKDPSTTSPGEKLTMMTEDEIKDAALTDKTIDTSNLASRLQTAQNAIFEYNGIEITRDTNSISDLITGVTIKLNKVDKEGESSNFDIKQNTEGIVQDVEGLVNSYNNLMNNLSVATSYNSETGASGTFQGVSEITQIKSKINQIINGVSKDGKSIQDFGLSLSSDGLLKLEASKLKDALSNNFDNFKNFFSSKTEYTNVSTTGTKGVEAGELQGSLTINGKNIDIKTDSANNSNQNAKDILKAITSAGIDNIAVTIDKDGKLVIKGSGGENLEIKGDSTFLEKLGLKETELKGSSEVTGGFFKQLKDTLDSFIGTKGSLVTYEESLVSNNKQLTKEKTNNEESITKKYETMAEKWVQYDSMMAKIEQQFSTLKTMINAQLNSKS
ncbi:flagellar filament capping protein FliD [Campylobacter fetus]|uniref:flagellar filament capping protein FliD n=1 Tax=Campylobacter fetus TaxID=196 RepID=UPI000509195D|nr:flagellar filament capping protein FliD [Campylobacter fetus]AIR78054.1 flagellar filament cap protein [Campylobacter fetus subsp. fetus 04/554]EAJ5693924.1 flagellar filament capping protein FliD [Campylobacter fetus]EAJ5703617.1 flagellar filament capping protein FliD [Campylobacter fetus]EAJ9257066.1 flagellar filament capping protein FliD [Campylobacter fetus]EAK0815279.1 flagellar filament capping protein FliD [Campylobacter fetus]